MNKTLTLLGKKIIFFTICFFGMGSTVFGDEVLRYGDTVYIKNLQTSQYVVVIDSKLVGRTDLRTGFKVISSTPDKRGEVQLGDIVLFELDGGEGESLYIGPGEKIDSPFFAKKYEGPRKLNLLGLVPQKLTAFYFKFSAYYSGNKKACISLEVAQSRGDFFRFNIYKQEDSEIFYAPDKVLMNLPSSTRELGIEKKITALEPEEKQAATEEDIEKYYDVPKEFEEVDWQTLKVEAEKNIKANKDLIKSFYKVFNLNEDADEKKIMGAYRKLALVFHPDRPLGDIEVFRKIQCAKDVLIADKNFRAGKANKAELALLGNKRFLPKIIPSEMKAIQAANKESAIVKRQADLPVLKIEAEKNIKINKKLIEGYYKIFNLREGADVSAINKAFRKLALIFHPDKSKENREIFDKIQKAKNVLIAYLNFLAGKVDEAELKLLSKAEAFPKITQPEMKAIEAGKEEITEEEPEVETPSWKKGKTPITDRKEPVIGEKGEKKALLYGDEVYIKNFKIKEYATRDGNVLVGDKEPGIQSSFIIVADMEKPNLNKGRPITYGKSVYFKFKDGFIGDSGEEYTIYGMKRHLLGVVTDKEKIYKFTILPSVGKKENQPVYYGEKINLQYEIPTSKSPVKYFRFNVDISTYKKGTEVFGSDNSRLMTSLAIKLTKELIFEKAK